MTWPHDLRRRKLRSLASKMDILNHPFVMTDWLFVAAFCLLAALSLIFNKKCAYHQSTMLLAGQNLLTIGFSTLIIAQGAYDGIYFNLFMMFVYFQFYHFIDNTGDRFLSQISLYAGGFHLLLISGEIFNVVELSAMAYSQIMVGIMSAQLMLGFRGFIYGLNYRLNYDRRRNKFDRHGSV